MRIEEAKRARKEGGRISQMAPAPKKQQSSYVENGADWPVADPLFKSGEAGANEPEVTLATEPSVDY